MPTFTAEQQEKHREQFINDCRQKAWSAACHAEWVSKGLEAMAADYTKLEAELGELDEDIKATDYKTPESREKRKALQERRNSIPPMLDALRKNIQQGQQALNGLYQSVEASLQLAEHAETWKWKEVEAGEKKI